MTDTPENEPMLVTDLVAMFKATIGKNEGIMTAKVKELNNIRVDMWKRDVLDRMAVDGMVKPLEGTLTWDIYEEGLDVRKSVKQLHNVPEATPEQLKYWLDFFSRDIDVIHDAGVNLVSLGYGIVTTSFRNWMAREKFKRVYTSDDPLQWVQDARKHDGLMRGREMPFQNMQEIAMKARCVINTHIQPSH